MDAREIQALEAAYQRVLAISSKKTGGGYNGYIFTGNLELIKKIGLRTKRRRYLL